MAEILQNASLLLVLLNPFLLVVYLIDMVERLDPVSFTKVLVRASVISLVVFWVFAVVGDAVFSEILQARFASFQIFGGIVFLLIGLQFVFQGPRALQFLRGDSEHLGGAIAMPVMIGPGTLSASVLIGERLGRGPSLLAILFALGVTVGVIVGLKWLHDWVRPRREPLVERYIEIAGRISALIVGTVAIEMVMQGARSWAASF